MCFPPADQITIEQIVLERIRKTIELRTSEMFRKNLLYAEMRDEAIKQIIYRLRFELFGIHRQVEKEIKRPLDWREAIKERFFPVWLKKKFPVKFETIGVLIKVDKLCPHLNVAGYDNHIAWLANNITHENDWKTDKSVPDYLHETILLLTEATGLLSLEHPLMSHDLEEQAKKLKEIL